MRARLPWNSAHRIVCAIALFAATIADTAAAAPAPVVPTRIVLANGLRAYVEPIAGGPDVTRIELSLNASTALDPVGKEGTGLLAGASLVQAKFGATDGMRDADLTASGNGADLAAMLITLFHTVHEPIVSARLLDAARSQESAYLAFAASSEPNRIAAAFDRLIFASPKQRDVTSQSIAAVTEADIRTYVAANYVPERMSLAIVGNVDPQAVRHQLDATFATLPRGAEPSPVLPAAPPAPNRAVTIIQASGAGVHARIGQATIGRLAPGFYALNILNAVLDERLARDVVAPGIARAATSSFLATRDRGELAVDVTTTRPSLERARNAIKRELDRLINARVPAGEWSRARASLIGAPIVSDPSAAAAMSRCRNLALNDLPPDYFANIGAYYPKSPPATLLEAGVRLTPATYAEVIAVPSASNRTTSP